MKKGISLLEYCLFITVFIAALLGMQVYVKRGISGRWKEAGDIFGFGRQYDIDATSTIYSLN